MRDWMGNEIKDGDVILHIYTKPSYSKMSMGWIMPMGKNNKSKWIEVDLSKFNDDEENYWKEGNEYKVVESNGILFHYFTDSEGYTYYQTLESIHIFGTYDNSLLCIRGKSDKKELYYS